jgi:hypothetical protein
LYDHFLRQVLTAAGVAAVPIRDAHENASMLLNSRKESR